MAMPARPAGAGSARLEITPQVIQINGPETEVEVRLDGISGLYGLDVRLEFDPALLEVLDADDGKDGVQVSPGQIPSPDFVVRNEADNASGTLWYAVTQLNPRDPASGSGVVCTFSVRGLVDGSGEIRVVEAKLVDRSGADLPVETSGAQVTVSLEAAQVAEARPTATPTATLRPTEQATPTVTPTEEPTAAPEPDEAEATDEPTPTEEPTATAEPEGLEPTLTDLPAAEPPAKVAAAGDAPLSQPSPADDGAYPSPLATPLPAAGRLSPTTVPATPTTAAAVAPTATQPLDLTPTATSAPAATGEAMLLAAAQQTPAANGGQPATQDPSVVKPLIPPPLFAALLALVAVAALALAVYLVRHDARATRHTTDRSTL